MPKLLKKWLVNPCKQAVSDVSQLSILDTISLRNAMGNDWSLCTNECATTFENGLVFNNGRFYRKITR